MKEETSMYGWAGTILKVYLSEGKIVKDPLIPEFAKAFLGGRGFNSKIIYDDFDPSVIVR
jgi:aldehyde:ferredoxin oxidoreductase